MLSHALMYLGDCLSPPNILLQLQSLVAEQKLPQYRREAAVGRMFSLRDPSIWNVLCLGLPEPGHAAKLIFFSQMGPAFQLDAVVYWHGHNYGLGTDLVMVVEALAVDLSSKM